MQACLRVALHSAPDGGLRIFPGYHGRRVRVLETVHEDHDLVSLSHRCPPTRFWARSSNASVSLGGSSLQETPVQEILDELKQAKWLNRFVPKELRGQVVQLRGFPGSGGSLLFQSSWRARGTSEFNKDGTSKQKDACIAMMRYLIESCQSHKQTHAMTMTKRP